MLLTGQHQHVPALTNQKCCEPSWKPRRAKRERSRDFITIDHYIGCMGSNSAPPMDVSTEEPGGRYRVLVHLFFFSKNVN